jgi:hypothetical protein
LQRPDGLEHGLNREAIAVMADFFDSHRGTFVPETERTTDVRSQKADSFINRKAELDQLLEKAIEQYQIRDYHLP